MPGKIFNIEKDMQRSRKNRKWYFESLLGNYPYCLLSSFDNNMVNCTTIWYNYNQVFFGLTRLQLLKIKNISNSLLLSKNIFKRKGKNNRYVRYL